MAKKSSKPKPKSSQEEKYMELKEHRLKLIEGEKMKEHMKGRDKSCP